MKLSFDREHAPTSVAMVLAILMLIAAVVLLMLPKPDGTSAMRKIKKATSDAQFKEKLANEAVDQMRQQIANLTWAGSGQDIGETAQLVSQLATKHGLSVVSFRPGQTVDAGDLIQTGYIVNVTGAYPDMLDFVADLEKPATRLAVENVQLGSSDESTDNVTGTVGIETYTLTSQVTTTTTATKTTSKSGPTVKSKVRPLKGGENVKAKTTT